MEENVKKANAIIFKEFCPSHMKNEIKEHHEYDIIINYLLKLIDGIDH